jgi:hypothetical protein
MPVSVGHQGSSQQTCMLCYQRFCWCCCCWPALQAVHAAAAACAHWVKEDKDEIHVVRHPHDAVFDWKGVLHGAAQNKQGRRVKCWKGDSGNLPIPNRPGQCKAKG